MCIDTESIIALHGGCVDVEGFDRFGQTTNRLVWPQFMRNARRFASLVIKTEQWRVWWFVRKKHQGRVYWFVHI